jgi:hypothetical protein
MTRTATHKIWTLLVEAMLLMAVALAGAGAAVQTADAAAHGSKAKKKPSKKKSSKKKSSKKKKTKKPSKKKSKPSKSKPAGGQPHGSSGGQSSGGLPRGPVPAPQRTEYRYHLTMEFEGTRTWREAGIGNSEDRINWHIESIEPLVARRLGSAVQMNPAAVVGEVTSASTTLTILPRDAGSGWRCNGFTMSGALSAPTSIVGDAGANSLVDGGVYLGLGFAQHNLDVTRPDESCTGPDGSTSTYP